MSGVSERCCDVVDEEVGRGVRDVGHARAQLT
jgi:hypothetical protein